jgi:NAD(P)-dependent dehydrogenase (short-subunit alcohol dehydrogenase family)
MFPDGAAIVTGGSGGIGMVICRRLAEAGADVMLTYRHNRAAAEKAAESVRAAGRKAMIAPLATEDSEAVKAFLDQTAKSFGSIHTLVYASGPDIKMNHISKVSPEQFRDFMLQDAVGFYNLVFHAIPHLRQSRGSIVACHTAGLKRYPARDILSIAPKAAVEAIIRGVAKEEGRYGIRANGVGVGGVEAGMHWRLREVGHYTPEVLELARRNRSLRHAGTAEDVAEAVLFFACNKTAHYVTGQSVNVDGGYAI